MTNNKFIFLLFTLAVICIGPSWAADSTSASPGLSDAAGGTSTINPPEISTDNISQASNSSTVKTNQAIKATLPKKVFSIATALFVGTPVCIVRRTKYEEWYGVKGLIGDSNNKCKKLLAGIVWLPCAVICGTGEAPFDAVANGLMYPAFSKDQLSQGKLIQNN